MAIHSASPSKVKVRLTSLFPQTRLVLELIGSSWLRLAGFLARISLEAPDERFLRVVLRQDTFLDRVSCVSGRQVPTQLLSLLLVAFLDLLLSYAALVARRRYHLELTLRVKFANDLVDGVRLGVIDTLGAYLPDRLLRI